MYEIELNGTPVKIWAKGVNPHAMKKIVTALAPVAVIKG